MPKYLKCLALLAMIQVSSRVSAQLAPDFTITDSDGNEHTLYADYLNQGKTVLIEIFFTTCPPCNAFAPYMEPLYEDWGSGDYDVEFFDLSDKAFDTDVLVNNYKATHGHTYPAAGAEGGSLEAVMPYKQGMFGPFYGTPTFVVIAPDGTVQYDVDGGNNAETVANLDAAIAATGAQRPECLVAIAIEDSFCPGDSVLVNGEWYSEAGSYNDTISGGDCDTVIWITITGAPLAELELNTAFCQGDSVEVYDEWYDEAGTYFDIVNSQTSGCDTLVTIHVNSLPLNTKTVNASFTPGDSVQVYDTWYNATGTHMIIVQSVTGSCDTSVTIHILEIPDIPIDVMISGFIRTVAPSAGIANAEVQVTLDGQVVARDTTDLLGRYAFTLDSLYVIGNPLQLEVTKTINPFNGVTVLDLVALQKHLLGLDLLDSVEKLFAADVNHSLTLSVLDVLYLRRLLLGFETQFPTPATWLFYHESQAFEAPGEQPPVVESPAPVILSNILNGTQTGDFRGIKIGDLNNSANPQN